MEGDADYKGNGPSQESGLEFELNSDGNTYSVKGIGQSTDTDLSIPAKYNDKNVTAIAANAFNGSNLTSVSLANGIVEIGEGAFSASTELLSVSIPDSVTTVGASAFLNCTKLMVAVIKDTSSIVSIHDNTFQGCTKLRTVNLPDGLKSIGDGAFRNCSSLNNVTVKSGLTAIGARAFENCSSLENLTLSDGLKSIGASAFQGCTAIEEIVVPDSVTKIGFGAFENCSSLASITVPFVGAAANPDHTDTDRKADDSGLQLTPFAYIFGGAALGPQDTEVGKAVPESVKTVKITGTSAIPISSFVSCTHIETIILGDAITHIGDTAFAYCYSLKNLVIGKGITNIGEALLNFTAGDSGPLYKIYYRGTASDWSQISLGSSGEFSNNAALIAAPRYYYSEQQPASSGNYWHYVDGVVTVW